MDDKLVALQVFLQVILLGRARMKVNVSYLESIHYQFTFPIRPLASRNSQTSWVKALFPALSKCIPSKQGESPKSAAASMELRHTKCLKFPTTILGQWSTRFLKISSLIFESSSRHLWSRLTMTWQIAPLELFSYDKIALREGFMKKGCCSFEFYPFFYHFLSAKNVN